MSPCTNTSRFGKKWTIPELIALEREFDLLHLSVHDIAKLHKRTDSAIVSKLQSEGLIEIENNSFSYEVLHAVGR